MNHFLALRPHWLANLGLILGVGVSVAGTVGMQAQPKPSRVAVTVYKTPTCGCCSKWVEHMKGNGFDVKAIDLESVDHVKRANGVPGNMESCHTALVGGYVVEGHVPAASVQRMLREKPAIAGIAAPGMPVGSPGMEIPNVKPEAFSVMAFDKAGNSTVYEKR